MIHISEKRIIASGVEALLIGDITKGVMKGNNMLSYFPFHLAVDQRIKSLIPWINRSSWARIH